MIEGPRALRICVPDLNLATRWYAQAFDTQPDAVRPEGVSFHVQGFAVLLVPGAPSPQTPVVYWGVEDVAAELQRLQALHGSDDRALVPMQDDSGDAIILDPFGNAFGLTSLGDSARRRARNQRSAEKIALRNVRETLDSLQQDEQLQRRTRRIVLLVGILVVVALAVTTTVVIQRAKNLRSDNPLTIPKLERPS